MCVCARARCEIKVPLPLLYVVIQFSQNHLLNRLSFSVISSWHPYQKLVDCIHLGLFLGSRFCLAVPHVCGFMPVLYCFGHFDFAFFFLKIEWSFFFLNFFLLVWFHISFRCFSISIKMPLEFWWRLHLIWIPLWISCEFDAVYVCHECFRLPMHGSFTSLVSDFNSCSFLHKTVGFEEQVGAGWEAFWTSIIAEPKHPLKVWSWSDCSNYLGLL